HMMLANRWGDGLPLWPPTRERADWILRGSTQPRRHRIGIFPPRGGVTTVETCAIALAMAGGRPEYLPVLVAAVDAFLDPESGSAQLQAASGSAFGHGQSSISLAFANGATNIRRRGAKKETPEEDALQGMYRMADFMRVPNMPGLAGYEHGTPGILMIPGVVANTMAGLGWTKASIREFLWEHSRIPTEHLRRAGCP